MIVTCKNILAKGKASMRGILSERVRTKGELNAKDTATLMIVTKHAPMKKAFTMLELIFVIILVSILTSIGIGFIPNYDVQNDTNFVFMKIKEKQKNAINYDTNNFANTPWNNIIFNSKEYNLTCIQLNQVSLNTIERASNEQKKHIIKTDINVTNLIGNTLCFDFLGRPYDYNANQLLQNRVDINMSFMSISVYPISGYVKIQ